MSKKKKPLSNLPADFNRDAFARSVRKIMEAAISQGAMNCFTNASLAQRALVKLGVPAELHVGYASWRVDGETPHGVVAHHPQGETILDPTVNDEQVVYHAWIKAGLSIIDFTTYQLPEKARFMDSMDGNTTPVNWAPDYLWVSQKSCKPYKKVLQSYKSGVYSYDRKIELETFLKETASKDPGDTDVLLFLYEKEKSGAGLNVFGPNNLIVP